MKAYRAYTTVKKSRRVELSGLPFNEGQRVEVVVLADERSTASLVDQARDLFAASQRLFADCSISEDKIRDEIEAYRKSTRYRR